MSLSPLNRHSRGYRRPRASDPAVDLHLCVDDECLYTLTVIVNPEVDTYIDQSEKWPEEMKSLRPILLDAGLTEEIKWRQPCYCHEGKNVAILQGMNDFLSLMFFKGALLEDPDGVLEDQGENTRSARRICFRSVEDVIRLSDTVKAYLKEAIDVEEAGLEVGPAPEPDLVEELQVRLDQDPELKEAFGSLTPGRRREYNIYFSGAKQAKTRRDRVDRYTSQIRDGKGLRDR